MDELTQAAPAAVGAIAGGGGVTLWAKLLFHRLISQYDKRLDGIDSAINNMAAANALALKEMQSRIDTLKDRLADATAQARVFETLLKQATDLKPDLTGQIEKLRGEIETKQGSLADDVDDLRRDVFVAHERVRLLASGDTDLSKIQKPQTISKRR